MSGKQRIANYFQAGLNTFALVDNVGLVNVSEFVNGNITCPDRANVPAVLEALIGDIKHDRPHSSVNSGFVPFRSWHKELIAQTGYVGYKYSTDPEPCIYFDNGAKVIFNPEFYFALSPAVIYSLYQKSVAAARAMQCGCRTELIHAEFDSIKAEYFGWVGPKDAAEWRDNFSIIIENKNGRCLGKIEGIGITPSEPADDIINSSVPAGLYVLTELPSPETLDLIKSRVTSFLIRSHEHFDTGMHLLRYYVAPSMHNHFFHTIHAYCYESGLSIDQAVEKMLGEKKKDHEAIKNVTIMADIMRAVHKDREARKIKPANKLKVIPGVGIIETPQGSLKIHYDTPEVFTKILDQLFKLKALTLRGESNISKDTVSFTVDPQTTLTLDNVNFISPAVTLKGDNYFKDVIVSGEDYTNASVTGNRQ